MLVNLKATADDIRREVSRQALLLGLDKELGTSYDQGLEADINTE